MTQSSRKQLTLFVAKNDAYQIEFIREKFNPEQHKLVNCHVTLCREDEITNLENVLENLRILDLPPITIQFAKAIRFDNGKGVLLPGANNNNEFHQLRQKILGDVNNPIRIHLPHITLMHPGNSSCTDGIFETITKASLATYLKFQTVSLIEQIDGGQWQTIRAFNLK